VRTTSDGEGIRADNASVRALSILLCDSHRVFTEALSHALTARGHEVVAILNDPRALVDASARMRPDVCVTDVVFHGESALDALGGIVLRAGAVVVLTASLDQLVLDRCHQAGVAWAAKHWPLAEVLAVIERAALGTGRSAPSAVAGHGAPDPWEAHPLAAFLTAREREVLVALVVGETTKGLAARLGISPATVRTHIQTLLRKLGVHTRVEAVSFAVRNSLVAPRHRDQRGDAAHSS